MVGHLWNVKRWSLRQNHCHRIVGTWAWNQGHFVNKDINWNIWFFRWFNFRTYIGGKCGSNRSNDPLLHVAPNIPNRRPLPEYAVRDTGLNIAKYCSLSNLFDIVSKYRQILFLRRGSPLCTPIYLCLLLTCALCGASTIPCALYVYNYTIQIQIQRVYVFAGRGIRIHPPHTSPKVPWDK